MVEGNDFQPGVRINAMSEREYDVLDIIHSMLETDRTFYGIVRFLNGGTRDHIIAAHMRNTSALVGLLRQYMLQSPITNMVLNIPIRTDISGNFFDPVVVAPTQQQIAAAVDQHVGVHDTTCSICQEPVECATRIRSCGHCFHSDCIAQWFSVNPRCPMCRHDIRDLRAAGNEVNNEGGRLYANEG